MSGSAKQPVGVTPITVPTVAVTFDGAGQVTEVFVDGLWTRSGPTGCMGRKAWLLLSANQAEVLMRELAAKLGFTVDSTSTL